MTKLLLVEDDIFLLKIYKLKLEKEGFEVVILENGSEVFETAKKYKPDLILLDIMMPVKDGFTVLKELEENEVTKNIPVLVLSALQMEEDIKKGKSLGADEYYTKTNVTMDQVISRIKDLTG